jgi:hypothetical protein
MSLQDILNVVQNEIGAAEKFVNVEIPRIKAIGSYLDSLKPELDTLLVVNPQVKGKFDEFVVLVDHLVSLLPTEIVK